MPRPSVLIDPACEIAENPLWDAREHLLYWCDVRRGQLYRFDITTERLDTVYESGFIGGFTFQENGSLLLFENEGRIVDWDGHRTEEFHRCLPDEHPGVMFNDVIADPAGRVYCGVRYKSGLPDSHGPSGGLYRLDTDNGLTKVVDGIEVSNGLGFSADLGSLYYTDSGERVIYEFDYDENSGRLSNQRVFVDEAGGDGIPDGLTVDKEGHVWSAHAFAGRVVRYTPEGDVAMTIDVPTTITSSLTFGGPDFRTLFITTGGGDEKSKYGPSAGSIFQARPVVGGVEEFRSSVSH